MDSLHDFAILNCSLYKINARLGLATNCGDSSYAGDEVSLSNKRWLQISKLYGNLGRFQS